MSRATFAIARGPRGWALRRGGSLLEAHASLPDAVAAARALALAASDGGPALIGIDCQCARPLLPLEWRPPKLRQG
ncbi:MAG: hypothetical protein U1E53_03375 [Dongiaceae bacterium]